MVHKKHKHIVSALRVTSITYPCQIEDHILMFMNSESFYLIYSVTDNVAYLHHILHVFEQTAAEQLVQSGLRVAQFGQGGNGLQEKHKE